MGGHSKVARQIYECIILLEVNEELGRIIPSIARSMRADFKHESNELLKKKKLVMIENLFKACHVQSCSWQQCMEWFGERRKRIGGD